MSMTITVQSTTTGGNILVDGTPQITFDSTGVSIPVNSSIVPPGTIIHHSSANAPLGYLAVPTAATYVSNVAYSTLNAALNGAWGSNGAGFFGLPVVALNQSLVFGNATTVGTTTSGSIQPNNPNYAGSVTGYAGMPVNTNITTSTPASPSGSNLSAGTFVKLYIKY